MPGNINKKVLFNNWYVSIKSKCFVVESFSYNHNIIWHVLPITIFLRFE